jgi:hypothetical protein
VPGVAEREPHLVVDEASVVAGPVGLHAVHALSVPFVPAVRLHRRRTIAAARDRAIEPGAQLAQLGLPADEDAAGWLGGRRVFGDHQRRSAATADRPAGAVASSARLLGRLRGPEVRGARRRRLPITAGLHTGCLPGPRSGADHFARHPGENHPEQEHVEGVGQHHHWASRRPGRRGNHSPTTARTRWYCSTGCAGLSVGHTPRPGGSLPTLKPEEP